MSRVLKVENLSKSYRLGQITGRTLTEDLNRWWARLRNKPDPYLRIGDQDYGNRQDEHIWALKDISFDVQQGEVLGIIGRNGAGKSTLLKILSRITTPTFGEVKVKGRVGSLLEVGTGFHPELTGRENIYLNGAILGMAKKEVKRKFDEIVDFAGIEKFIDTPAKRYSSGMYVRLAFAVAAHLDPEILLVDEVLAVGDAEFQKKCLGKMGEVASEGRTVLFVSHNMESIINLCKSAYVLEKGHITFEGNARDAVNWYLLSVSNNNRLENHILYQDNQKSKQTKLVRIEILDSNLNPKEKIHTWDQVVVRFHYYADRTYKHGSFILDFWDLKNQRLAVLDSGLKVPIIRGYNFIDCQIPCIPFSAGEYYLGAGLAISNNQWLWRNSNLTTFQILGKDVFELGRPPRYQRMVFAIEHQWQ